MRRKPLLYKQLDDNQKQCSNVIYQSIIMKEFMTHLIKALMAACIFFSYLFGGMAYAAPKSVQLEYEVSRNDTAFGKVKESYQQTGSQYQIHAVTKGEGLYALLGERVLTSKGAVTKSGLVPSEFKLKRGDNARKSLAANFNWQTTELTMLVKGEKRKATLTTGAQDLASYVYQFMFTPPQGEKIQVSLTTGKRFKRYTYLIKASDVPIKAANGKTYQTLHLVNAEKDGKKKKELWLAPAMHYLPVKYLVVDKHGDKLEQTLTSIIIK